MYNLQVMLCKSGDTLFSPYCKEREEIAHGTNTKSACHVGLICHAVNRFPPTAYRHPGLKPSDAVNPEESLSHSAHVRCPTELPLAT